MRMDEFLRKNTETLKIRIDILFTVIILCVGANLYIHVCVSMEFVCVVLLHFF